LVPDATRPNSLEQLAERDGVVLRSCAGFNRVVQLSEACRLPTVVDCDDTRTGEDIRSKLALRGLIRADGGDVCPCVEPICFDKRSGRRRGGDDDTGAAYRLLHGIAESRGESQFPDL